MLLAHHDSRGVPHQARCLMNLPEASELAGKRVLDLWCRRGKGVCALADLVGERGSVLGVEPDAGLAAAASAYVAEHAAAAWPADVRVTCADPTDVRAAGVADGSVDVVIVNGALNLADDVPAALREIVRVLVPGGLLWHEAVLLAEDASEKEPQVADAANVFLSARTQSELVALLEQTGFAAHGICDVEPLEPVGPDALPALSGKRFCRATVWART